MEICHLECNEGSLHYLQLVIDMMSNIFKTEAQTE